MPRNPRASLATHTVLERDEAQVASVGVAAARKRASVLGSFSTLCKRGCRPSAATRTPSSAGRSAGRAVAAAVGTGIGIGGAIGAKAICGCPTASVLGAPASRSPSVRCHQYRSHATSLLEFFFCGVERRYRADRACSTVL